MSDDLTVEILQFLEAQGMRATGCARPDDTYCEKCDVFGHAKNSIVCHVYQALVEQRADKCDTDFEWYCMSCKQDLHFSIKKWAMGESSARQDFSPSGALVFAATGNYGSTVFDPMGQAGDCHLEIAICDECIQKFGDFVVYAKSKGPRKKWTYMTFDEGMADVEKEIRNRHKLIKSFQEEFGGKKKCETDEKSP
jgi:hypothetical protein